MKKKLYILFLLIIHTLTYAQHKKTDANIIGHVKSEGEHIAFASVFVSGTTIGTVTDETGHFQLVNLPVGKHTIGVTVIGYKPKQKDVTIGLNETKELNFELEEDYLNLEEVVVSADRSSQKRTEAPVIVTTVSPKLFHSTQSITLGEGLNFAPGLRLENNCQNCGFTQIRMNGMEGSYSQILINSRPVLSGLASVYGLELIPATMIEKVEIVRGGGSALYGSNAIAGTINVIMKEPNANMYEAGAGYSLTGIGSKRFEIPSPEYNLNFNTSMVSADNKSGISLYAFTRDKDMFDANNDGYSEIAKIKNTSFGSRFYHRIGYRGKMNLDFFTIKEDRDGGNKLNAPFHERDIAEAVTHDLKTASITFEQYFRDYDQLSVFLSGQFLNRDSYYGANKSLKDYGNTKEKTYHAGMQYKLVFSNSTMITGIENTISHLNDKKLGYPDLMNAEIRNDSIIDIPHHQGTLVANQSLITSGIFTQYELKHGKSKLIVGGRYDHYSIKDLTEDTNEYTDGDVFSPRLSYMYELLPQLQLRLSYSQGYRAPQIFDEDLHIETSGSRKVINVNDPNLTQETSHSAMLSFDYNGIIGKTFTGFLIEGFYTRLVNPFVNQIGMPDEYGTVIYTRVNAEEGATVSGVTVEYKVFPTKNSELMSGFTIQTSKYDTRHEFNEKRFFRTPNNYGYLTMEYDPFKKFSISATGNYTGSMLIPYFGVNTGENGELRKSKQFFDLGLKLRYTVKINGASVQTFGGMKNIFNAYQSDFDTGINRDPAYIYGPLAPRTIYFGIKFGNFLD